MDECKPLNEGSSPPRKVAYNAAAAHAPVPVPATVETHLVGGTEVGQQCWLMTSRPVLTLESAKDFIP